MREPEVLTYTQSDGYTTHYRLWGAPQGVDVVVLLHGGMSHSGWQSPLADAIVSSSDVSFIATDRRGSGLNTESRGHLDSLERVVEDVGEFLESRRGDFRRVHLAGWCFGGQVATVAAARAAHRDLISTLLLIAPGFFFNERYTDVLRLSIESARQAVKEFGLDPEPTHPFIQVPLQPADFTSRSEWQRFISEDRLRLTKVTDRTVDVWAEIAQRAEEQYSRIGDLPLLVVLGSQDRLVDVERVRQFVLRGNAPSVEVLDTGHAVQFEQPQRLAEILLSFVSQARWAMPLGPAGREG